MGAGGREQALARRRLRLAGHSRRLEGVLQELHRAADPARVLGHALLRAPRPSLRPGAGVPDDHRDVQGPAQGRLRHLHRRKSGPVPRHARTVRHPPEPPGPELGHRRPAHTSRRPGSLQPTVGRRRSRNGEPGHRRLPAHRGRPQPGQGRRGDEARRGLAEQRVGAPPRGAGGSPHPGRRQLRLPRQAVHLPGRQGDTAAGRRRLPGPVRPRQGGHGPAEGRQAQRGVRPGPERDGRLRRLQHGREGAGLVRPEVERDGLAAARRAVRHRLLALAPAGPRPGAAERERRGPGQLPVRDRQPGPLGQRPGHPLRRARRRELEQLQPDRPGSDREALRHRDRQRP